MTHHARIVRMALRLDPEPGLGNMLLVRAIVAFGNGRLAQLEDVSEERAETKTQE